MMNKVVYISPRLETTTV